MTDHRNLWAWAFLPCGGVGLGLFLAGLLTDGWASTGLMVAGAVLGVAVPWIIRPIARDLDTWAQTRGVRPHQDASSDSMTDR